MASDGLLALRDAIKRKARVNLVRDSEPTASLALATHVTIDGLDEPLLLQKSTPTRFRKPAATATDPAATPTDFYVLGAVLAVWLFRDDNAAEYIRHTRDAGYAVGFVSVTERKALLDWLEGRRQEHERITSLIVDSTTPPGTPPPATTTLLPSAPGETSTSTGKRRYVPDSTDVEVVKKMRAFEVELRDRNSVLRGSKANNFSNVKNMVSERLKKLKDAAKPGQPSAASAPKPGLDPKLPVKKRTNYPIIVISSSPTSLITMHNVKRFLEEAAFETSEEARARAAAAGISKPDDVIAIYRKRTHIGPGGKETETKSRYFIVDSIEALAKFGADPWDRVVCVMTTGQQWQFKPYKWSEPLQLFHNVKGIYVAWANDPPNPKIKDWNVTELKIDPHRRHVDKSVVAHFWKTLDTWMSTNKPGLL